VRIHILYVNKIFAWFGLFNKMEAKMKLILLWICEQIKGYFYFSEVSCLVFRIVGLGPGWLAGKSSQSPPPPNPILTSNTTIF
jgi:hypothetical protein